MFFRAMRTMTVTLALYSLSSGMAWAQAPPPPAAKEGPPPANASGESPPPAEPASTTAPAEPAATSPSASSIPSPAVDTRYVAQSLASPVISGGGVRDRSGDSLLLPEKALEIGAEMTFLTSKTPLG